MRTIKIYKRRKMLYKTLNNVGDQLLRVVNVRNDAKIDSHWMRQIQPNADYFTEE